MPPAMALQWQSGATLEAGATSTPPIPTISPPTIAQNNGILAPRPICQSWPTIVFPHHSTRHPAMAPSNGILLPFALPQSRPTIVSPHSTLGTLAPHPICQSWPAIVSPHHSTLQWHPAMAPWRHVRSAKVGPHYNGTLQWQPGAGHVHSPKVGPP